jgi:hypothetical protein
LLTGAIVHYGDVRAVVAARQVVLGAAYAVHPERFVRQLPAPPALPSTGDRDLLYVAAQKLVAEHREEILNYVNRPAQ